MGTTSRPRSRSRAPGTRPIGSGPGGAATAAGDARPEMPAVTRRDERADAPRAVGIVHDIPARLRLRLPPGARTAGLNAVGGRVTGALGSVWAPRTRSLLLR